MVKIISFRGTQYNAEKIKNLEAVMSPPYDIISPKVQEQLYKKNPYNMVRLIFGKQYSDDTSRDNRYTRAAVMFEEWQKKNILIESDKPAIYPYRVAYTVNGNKKKMNSFFTLLKLDPEYKTVKAHERTLSKPKADRLDLMRACKANLEPIELLYIDENDEIRKLIDNNVDNPIIDIAGYDGFRHMLWKIDDEKIVSSIVQKLQNERLFIADGHHRYQTAINYANEMKEQNQDYGDDTPFNYRMVVLANMFDEGLSILPTHRLIKSPSGLNNNEFINKLKDYFIVEQKSFVSQINDYEACGKEITNAIKTEKGDKHVFGMYIKDICYILTLKNVEVMNSIASDHSKTWRMLDVSILHKIILEKLMKITEDNIEEYVKYTRNDGDAVKLVDDGSFDLSFLMNATKIDELKSIANAGEHMPQKSTYFLPKLLSGLVMRKIE